MTVLGMIVAASGAGYGLVESTGVEAMFSAPPTAAQIEPAADEDHDDHDLAADHHHDDDAATTTATAHTNPPSTNLLTPAQANFNGTAGGWQPVNATLSPAQGSAPGSSALEVTATATSWVSAWSALSSAGTPAAATPGDKYIGDASVEAPSAGESLGDAIAFYNSAGTGLTAVFGQALSPSAGTWDTLPEVEAIAPATTAYVVFGVLSWAPSVGQDFLIESPTLSNLTTPAVAPSVVGPLITMGNQIIQANGQAITLRGVVMPGLQTSSTLAGTGVSQQAVIEAKEWGANFVRVPLGEQYWLLVELRLRLHLRPQPSTRWSTGSRPSAWWRCSTCTPTRLVGVQTGSQHNMADEAQARTFWSQVAGRYGNPTSPEYSPLVAFDLYNEPHDITQSVWLNGGQTTDTVSGTTYEAAGMQELYDSVRAAGSDNLTFISGLNWASTPPTTLINGVNIVYGAHYYSCPSNAPPNCSNPDPYDPSQVLSQWTGLGATQPIVVTEFGWPSQYDGTYDDNVIAYAAEHGWGWSAFAWEDLEYPSAWDLNLAFLFDGTAEPAPSGMPVLLALSEST